MREALSSLRARVLLLIAIPFALILSTSIYHELSEREDRLMSARAQVLDTARAMVAEQLRIIEHVHQALASAALLPELRRAVASEECDRALAVRHSLESNLNGMLFALTNGDVICSAKPASKHINLADRDFFKAAIQTRKFSAGGYVISRNAGAPGFGFAYPVLDEAGVPRGVIATSLSLAWLELELAKARLPEGSRIGVVDAQGIILARHPDPEQWVGKSAAGLSLWKNVVAKGGEGTAEDVGLDGLRRIFGFLPLHRTASGQAYLWVGIPEDVVFEPAQRAFFVTLLVESALLVLTFGALWLGSESLFVRRMAALARAAKELGKGNLAIRLGFKASGDEIGQLAQSFDRMAEGLQTKETQLVRANRALRTLSACNGALFRAAGESEFLGTICRLIVDVGGYSMAWVGYAQQDSAKTVRVASRYGADAGYVESLNFTWADTELGRGPTGTAIRTGATQVNQSFLTDPSTVPWRDGALASGLRSSIALPLKGPSGSIGALTLYARESDAFDAGEIHLLGELADNLGFGIVTLRTRAERDRIAHAHQQQEEKLRRSLEDSIAAISYTVEMRDPYTAGHQKRVAALAATIANELGLPEDEVQGIRLAASVHDLGKIQVPAEILSKPGKLTGIEFALIKGHPQAGYDILKGIEFPWPIANIVLQHHERLDGSGYPQGLKGEQILMASRIIALADVVEAMASHRPYRPALGIDAALAETERGRGTAFDPAVVDACLTLFRERRFAFST